MLIMSGITRKREKPGAMVAPGFRSFAIAVAGYLVLVMALASSAFDMWE
jgi:hypothetical protein